MTSRTDTHGLGRRAFILAGAAGAAAPLLLRGASAFAEGASPKAFGFPPADTTSRVVRPIVFPVEGKVTWSDTYGACRDGCSRKHEGQDLLGKKLQKLLSCVDGKVVALRHQSSGNSLYIEDEDGWYYAYLHINNDKPDTDDGSNPIEWAFAPGLSEGDTVRKGQFVAYMGDSGNAEGSTPHLHFEVRKPSSGGVWTAQAVNPKASLDAATTAAPIATAPTGPFAPFASAAALITQQYRDVLGHDPSPEALSITQAGLRSTLTAAALIESLIGSDENEATAGAVSRLYRAYFGRDADYGGLTYWIGKVRKGTELGAVSDSFARSSEFVRTYGSLGDPDFVSTVYRNVLGRDGDAEGKAFWIDQLKRKRITRGKLMLRFSESSENQAKLRSRTAVVLTYAQMLLRVPPPATLEMRVKQLTSGALTPVALIEDVRVGAEYAKRF